MSQTQDRLGVAVVGLGGAVATTAIAGIESIKSGSNDLSGLPLADRAVGGLKPYDGLVFGGWDLCEDDLGTAALGHGVLSEKHLSGGAAALKDMHAWPAVGSEDFCKNVTGGNKIAVAGHRGAVERIHDDLSMFKEEQGLDRVVMLNLASTERTPDLSAEAFSSREAFERALDRDDPEISPAMLYAYAAITADTPYGNFTPSVAADVPVLAALAAERGVPVAGKDGKTGQTFLKTVIAPALRARALHVDGWFSTNILGNRDGLALDDPNSLKSKVGTKLSVLDQILGYPVEDHQVHIHYYRPRGDDKEAWDNIDISGFLGERMQIKVDFLCKDSVLAAPLAIEIARTLDLAKTRGQGGVQEQLSVFFKMPQTKDGALPEHAFLKQVQTLDDWLGEA
ncbi:inositol-3-phosphate synthase [Parvularcula dongshanensis]|uniref:Myo-inositol-1-phosphate synthase n=1 Tax=Parvularcula dongshanensis TaxID=1173995 RepID=A0A840I0Z6_9PROT|nr:inositol-3-phosphate synthase [Parvularcula dongshanensis]MBB4658407.1 myo-inositol-1-phosphate synthase [Parvularcula dongshanensis]